MQRADEMASRLPLLYQDGELLRGSESGASGGLLEVPAVQFEILDEDGREVQISHWFETARALGDAGMLAALLDFTPEPWQNLEVFRAWVDSNRDAMLLDGAVTKAALQDFVVSYSARFQAAADLSVVRINQWADPPSRTQPSFVENPLLRRYQRVPDQGGIEPLFQFSLVQRGLDDSFASFLLSGLPEAPESAPVIVNLTTGEALIYLGNIDPGQRLAIRATQDGKVTAALEGADVTGRLRSVTGLQPGTPWQNSSVMQPARALTLKRGSNDLWFLPVAHYDTLGLDRFLLSLADLIIKQGRFGQSGFDQALFYQEPAVILRVSWLEVQPAKFDVRLPAGSLISKAGGLEKALTDRDALGTSLDEGVRKLRAAGVASTVSLLPFAEVQGQLDLLTSVLPMTVREIGPSGADRLPDAGGVFQVTSFDNSTFR